MLQNLSVELILLKCEFLNSTDLENLAWTNRRMMQIVRRYLSIALEPKIPIEKLYITHNETNV